MSATPGVRFVPGVAAPDEGGRCGASRLAGTRVALLCALYWVTLGAALAASTMVSVWSDRSRLAEAQGNADFLVTYSVDVNVGAILALVLIPPLVLIVVWWWLRRHGGR